MERYNSCTTAQKNILSKMYEYFGFNEVISFEDFIEFVFFNSKQNIVFYHIASHTIEHIIRCFWKEYPEYLRDKYIKTIWIDPKKFINSLTVGDKTEIDPKGIVRAFVRKHYKHVIDSKR